MLPRPIASAAAARALASRLRRAVVLTAAAALAAAQAQPVTAGRAARHRTESAVTHWNAVATDAFTPSQGTNPMAQSRALAILHASIHDAVNAIEPRFQAYTPGLGPAPGASLDAAVAAAAREVLVTLLPEQSALVETAYERSLAAVHDGRARDAGAATGRAAARATLARRADDGFETAAQPAYVPLSGVGEYQFTPPFDFAAQPGWGRVQPFVVELGAHALEGPQPPTSEEYARDLAQVRAIGRIDSAARTAEQAEIARFWYEDSPLGWNRVANAVVRARGLDPWEEARALALVNFAMADGFIVGFEAKYRFRFWRPETAIRAAAGDGNPLTEADEAWKPLLDTPPVPDYPSTHTVLGWAAAEVLIALLGDEAPITMTSLTLPGVTRRYDRLSTAAEENGLSRVYAGIHFQHAVRDGQRQGRSVGRAVAEALPPLAPGARPLVATH